MDEWIRQNRLIPALYSFCPLVRVDRQVMTPNQEILMRFELHTVTLIPIISQLPPARLACWPHSTSVGAECLLQAAFLLLLKLQHSVGQPLWPPPHLPGFPCDRQGAAAAYWLSHLRVALAVRRLRRCLVKSSCARGKAWLTMDFGSQPWEQHHLC